MPHSLTTYKSKPYRTFVESLPCCVANSKCQGQIVAHHTAGKHYDLNCIPVCNWHHNGEYHQKGRAYFEAVNEIDVCDVIYDTNKAYKGKLEGK